MEFLNPDTVAPPASDYSHGVVVPAAARRLIVAGQVGLNPDGSLAEGLEAQMERCWLNLFAVLEAAGMTKRDLGRAMRRESVSDIEQALGELVSVLVQREMEFRLLPLR